MKKNFKTEDIKYLFEDIFNIFPHAIMIVNSEGMITFTNKASESIFQYKKKELNGLLIDDLIAHSYRNQYHQFRNDFFASPQTKKMSNRNDFFGLKKNGNHFPLEIELQSILIESQMQIILIMIDITEKIQQKNDIESLEQKYSLLIDGVKDYGIYMLDPEGMITTWNTGAKRIKGYDEFEIIGKHFSIFFQKTDIEGNKPKIILENAIKNGFSETKGFRVRKDGSCFYAHTTITSIYDKKQKLFGFSKIVKDITEQKKLQNALKEREKHFKNVIEIAPTGLIIVSSDGKMVLCNQQIESMFGYTREELLDHPIEKLLPIRNRGDHPTYRDSFFKNPQLRKMGEGRDLYGLHKNGSHIPVEIGLSPLNIDGSIYVLASVIDITKRKEIEEKLKIYSKNIEIKNKELEEFVHTVSHDLRAPLVTISMFAEKILSEIDTIDQKKIINWIQRIHKNSIKMDHLLKDLLDLSKIGQQDLKIKNFSLKETLSLAIDAIEQNKTDKKPIINLEINEFILSGQQNLMVQVFVNLLSNSIKYRKENLNPKIWIRNKIEGSFCRIDISDEGRGIHKDQFDKVFKIFERFHLDVKDGTGIGLAIVKKIIERHNGSISFESEENKGTTFSIFLPLSKES